VSHFISPRRSGFSLIEIVLAVGIFSFAIIAVVTLLPVGMQSEQASVDEASAGNLLRSIRADLLNSSGSASSLTVHFRQPLPATITSTTSVVFYVNDGESPLTSAAGARFQVNMDYFPKQQIPPSPVAVHVRVSWPAAAPATDIQGSVETYETFPQP
jgi:type II secretory pathway pseudopilin PulG